MLQFDVHAPAEAGVYLPDEPATLELGARLARALRPGLIVYLRGELGAGKTTLARGVLRGLGYAGRVKSPTFALVEVYRLSSLYLHHFDFYRFKRADEWIDAGFREMFGADHVCLIEWPDKAGALLPAADLELTLEHEDNGRRARLVARSPAGLECVQQTIA
jgi:tRNA threonylcarbamoyladenosine biosynthesis protein TsaE